MSERGLGWLAREDKVVRPLVNVPRFVCEACGRVAAIFERGLILRKEKEMKTAIAIVMILTLAILSGCQTSSRAGGSVVSNKAFRIAVPTIETSIKQGELQPIIVSLLRDPLFKQDVELQINAPKGISMDPTRVTVKASDKPDVQLQITAANDAAVGEYRVVVTATPQTGEPTSVSLTVRVVAP